MNYEKHLVILLVALVAFAYIFLSYSTSIYNTALIYEDQNKLKNFKNMNELLNFVKKHKKPVSNYYYWSPQPLLIRMDTIPMPIPVTFTLVSLSSNSDKAEYYSRTNVQVSGVDEADIAKTDGEFIYAIVKNEIKIIKAYSVENASVISSIKYANSSPSFIYYPYHNNAELYIYQDYLILILQDLPYYLPLATYASYNPPSYETKIYVYDLKNKENPKLYWNVTLEGFYLNSRLIEDNLYVLASSPLSITEGFIEKANLPYIILDDLKKQVSASEIYYSEFYSDHFEITLLLKLNLKNKSEEHMGFMLGANSLIYASVKNIYIIQTQRYENEIMTALHRISIGNELKYEASGLIKGYVLNQFSIDEYNSYLRIATTSERLENNVYILDMDLNIIGKIENIEVGEKIYSARFVGDKAYLVTFRIVDPFFVIDLSNIKEPKILGFLKIPGFSTYLHPINESLILGIGREEHNLKISLFDVHDFSNPKEVSKVLLPWVDSEVLYNHKAFLFDFKRNLIIIPIRSPLPLSSNIAILKVEENELTLKGIISHSMFGSSYETDIIKALFIENYLYTLSIKLLKINDINSLEEIKNIFF
jgi:uncharacterized secreted protein with C-terminal beta-propeller domain